MNADIRSKLDRIQRTALVVGVLAAIAVGAGFATERQQFYRSYLFAFMVVAMVPLGSLILTMIHYLTGGFWGVALRRQFQAAIRTLPLVAVLFVPIVIAVLTQPAQSAAHGEHGYSGNFWLYPWTDAQLVANDHLLAHKAVWLNANFFLGRAIFYFVFWIGTGMALLGFAAKADRTNDPAYERYCRLISGPGVLLFTLVTTFAVFDWAMSVEPKWFSTMYGVIYLVGAGLGTMAFSVVFTAWVRKFEPYSRFVDRSPGPLNLFHDMGTLMFAMIMLWAYTSFSQFLIIWSGNLAEETPWYLVRTQTSWQIVALALAGLHFALPFFLLLMRRIKRDASFVVPVALLVLVMRHVDMYWQVVPPFHPEGLAPHWLDFATPLALGGLWLAFFLNRMKSQPLTSPRHDLAIEAAIGTAHH